MVSSTPMSQMQRITRRWAFRVSIHDNNRMTCILTRTLGLSERGGVVGRGVLLDFVRYADLNGLHYDPMTNYAISLDQLKDMVKEEKLELRPGDILLVRCGISRWIRSASPDEEGPLGGFTHIGVDPTPELFEWLWDHNLAAVGGDAMAFEACPAPDGSSKSRGPAGRGGANGHQECVFIPLVCRGGG